MSNPQYHHFTRSHRRHSSSPSFRTFLPPPLHNVAPENSLSTRADTQTLDTVFY
jgi:hypothetical protein